MRFLIRISLFLSLFSLVFSEENSNLRPFQRPLILEYPERNEPNVKQGCTDEIQLQCTGWRFAVEANNLSPWESIPAECADYVKDYLIGRGYEVDLERVSKEAGIYARNVELNGDGKDVWIFDIDETLLSNLPYYAEHGYGLELFDSVEFDKWVEKGMAPAIQSSLKLYEEVLGLGFKVVLLTGRRERHRSVTVENLIKAGFQTNLVS